MAKKIDIAGELNAATTKGILGEAKQINYAEESKSVEQKLKELSDEHKDYEDLGQYTDSPEFIRVYTDADGKFLWGIRVDGSVEWAKGVPTPIQNALKELADKIKDLGGDKIEEVETALNEKIEALQDAIDVINASLKTLTDTFSYQDNPEFVNVVTDAEGKVLEATQSDGKKYFPKQALLDKYDDVEGRTEMTLDAENKVLAYRDKDGIKYESKLDVNKIYQNGTEIGEIASKDDIKDFATKEEVENITIDPSEINIADLEGVSDHNTPNLLIASQMQKTFNDGTNSFTPPNVGYEMSNPIECQAGDWFTRTGTATGMVVVTDENDKNGTRLFNADGTTLGNTFQVPKDMTWVRYIRMAALKTGAEDGSVVICKGKNAYTSDNRGSYITIENLRIEKRNLSTDIIYIKSKDGQKFYELYVDENGTVKAKEVDPDVIPENEYPSNWYAIELNGSFENYFDRICIQNDRFLLELKSTGLTKIKSIGYAPNSAYGNFEHFYTDNGDDRYVMNFTAVDNNTLTAGKRLTIYDKEFNIVDQNINGGDLHDFIYINDNHIITFDYESKEVNIEQYGNVKAKNTFVIREMKKMSGVWNVVAEFHSTDYPKLITDGFGEFFDESENTTMYSHQNTLCFDYDDNLIINCRNWDTWIKIKRTVEADGTITIGSKTLDYDEAIIGRVGGRHNSGYIDSKRVLNDGFSFTDIPQNLTSISSDDWEEWQWFHAHDVKYWGMKQIGDKQYPTYTLFDNNYWTKNEFVESEYNSINKHNNILINPKGSVGSYDSTNDDPNYVKYQYSRVVQLSIDWDNHKIVDYRIYYIPKKYSHVQCGATMYTEGIICMSYSYAGEFGLWDFTTGETEVSGHIYKGAKQLFLAKYDTYRICYRANTYKLNV